MNKNGFTMLELLVGLVVAMLCMIMMLMTFKQISKISLESSLDADYDTQVQLGMLVLQKVIQNAGYGSGQTTDIKVNSTNDMLYLRFIPNVNNPLAYTCQALGYANDPIKKEYKLFLFENSVNCGASTDLATIDWTNTNTTKSPLITIKNKNIEAATPAVFKFYVENLASDKKCTPYGISPDNPSGTKTVTVTAKGQHTTEKQIQSLICLNNI
ncbi:PilW family protein [Acinetobacter towneri]|uniref:PilW family protein n=1 Tax=Acinetobacter towneri TaxID=202956 RepID=UPI003A8713A9